MSSSKKSSSKKSSSTPENSIKNTVYIQEFNIIGVVVNILIIYYIINLEDISCNCIRDWRHNYIKYVAIFNIICNILILFNINNEFLSGINGILNLINLYAFFTYIGDLNDTKCECAVVKQENLNYFLNIWRYVIIIIPILGLLFIFGIISYHKKTTTKSLYYDPKLKIYTLKKN
jgi:hypothetical protein